MDDDRPSPATLVVAVDGPSGSGKSTVSRRVALARGLRYLDTGAMFRAVTWAALRDGIAPADAGALTALAERLDLRLATDPAHPAVHVGEVDVTTAVRGPEVTAAVSAVSAVPGVRADLLRRQRELIGAGRIVVEGRDIGSVVAPDATLKVFLTADPAARAARRARETSAEVGLTEADLARRDGLDSSRTTAPLARPAGAIEIDSTALGIDEVVAAVLTALDAAALRDGSAGPARARR